MVNGEKRVCRWERADTRVRPYEIIRMEQSIRYCKMDVGYPCMSMGKGGHAGPPLRDHTYGTIDMVYEMRVCSS